MGCGKGTQSLFIENEPVPSGAHNASARETSASINRMVVLSCEPGATQGQLDGLHRIRSGRSGINPKTTFLFGYAPGEIVLSGGGDP